MAATASRQTTLRDWPHLIRRVRLSGITSDEQIDVTHGGPSNVNADHVTWEVQTPPTAMCAFVLVRDRGNDSSSGGTTRLKFVAETGGDLTGLVVDVDLHFYHSASGGIS